jgi:hypothetical protein
MGRISSFFQTTKETTETILWFLGVVVMLGGIGVGFGKWFSSLNTFQTVSFFIMVGALFLIAVTLVLNWLHKRDVEKIPDLIEKLDVLTSNFVDDFKLKLSEEEWTNILRDYSSLLGLDFSGLEAAFKDGNKKKLETAFESFNRAYNRKLNPENKTAESLTDVGDMGSILDTYNAGFGCLKQTPQYQKLDKKIKALQRKAPSAYISVKVNDYYVVSEKLYTMILGTKPLYDQPLLAGKMPAKVKAKKSQVRPLIDGQISNLIAGVREAILKHKERNSGQLVSEQDGGKTEVQNREQRRARK